MAIEIDGENNKVIAGGTNIASIGIEQTWQDMTSQRVLDTDYTNDTGRPIQVSIVVQVSNIQERYYMHVDGIRIAIFGSSSTNDVKGFYTFSEIIPAGSVYHVEGVGGGSVILTWSELR
jgi:hypothetical protein